MTMKGKRRMKTGTRLGVVLISVFVLMNLGAGLAMASPGFYADIDNPVSVAGLHVEITGTADSPAHAFHHIEISWGDGTFDSLPSFETVTGPWTWGASHNYPHSGRYVINVQLVQGSNSAGDYARGGDRVRLHLIGTCDCEV